MFKTLFTTKVKELNMWQVWWRIAVIGLLVSLGFNILLLSIFVFPQVWFFVICYFIYVVVKKECSNGK